MPRTTAAPPVLPRLLLRAILPADSTAVLEDLDDEYRIHIAPHRSRVAGLLWYWRQVLGSLLPALRMRRRRRRQHDAGRHTERQPLTQRLTQQVGQDLAFAMRFLRRRPGFAAAAVATFALGIGVNTAVFSIVDGVLLRPLPYRAPDRLVRIWSANPRGIPRNNISPPDFFDLREQVAGARIFDSLSAYTAGGSAILSGDEPQRVVASSVTPDLFDTLGAEPAAGRVLMRDDSGAGRAAVAVVSHGAWTRVFSQDPSIVGRIAVLDATPYTVVGVMPEGFRFPSAHVDFWIPLSDATFAGQRSARYLDAVGRLAPGVARESAASALRGIAKRLEAAHPATDSGWGFTLDGLRESIVGGVERPLLVLLGAVGCVLLITCANVSSLLLARGVSRSRELALRVALGASRARILRQQLIESCVIALAGGTAGVLLASWSLDLLLAAAGEALPRHEDIDLDARVMGVTFVVAMMAGVATGLLPAWRASRGDADPLRSARAAGVSRAARRARSVLVVAEIALTLALMIGAGLLARSFIRLTNVDAGFTGDHVLLAHVSLPASGYRPDVWSDYFQRATDEIRTVPGVLSAGAVAPLPLSGQPGLMRFGLVIEGRPARADGGSDRVYLRWATPDYFRSMGIPILKGREFSASDRRDSPPVAVVDTSFARQHFPGEDPLGKRVRSSNDRTFREIVGIVGGVRQTSLDGASEPHLYVAQAQNPSPAMTFVVRTSASPSALAALVRARVRGVAPPQPVFNVRPLEEVLASAVAPQRFSALVLVLFALLAALLTLVGIYGLISYWVTESTREIGVRMALGANPHDVLSLVVGRSLRLTAAGSLAGVALALAGGRVIGGMLFEVAPTDVPTFAAAVTSVVGAGFLASYLPARRALSINPAESLRAE